MRRFAEVMLDWRWVVVSGLLVAVLASTLSLPRIQYSLSIIPLIEGKAEAKQRADQLEAELPSRFAQVCTLTWPRRIDRAELDWIGRLCAKLSADARVKSVTSLATVRVMAAGGLLPRPFLETLAGRDALAAAAAHPLLFRRLISVDGKSTSLLIEPQSTDEDVQEALFTWLQEVIPGQNDAGIQVRFVSGYVAQRARRSYMQEDLVVIICLELLIFSFLLPLVFRSVRGVVLPIAVVVTAVLLNFGLLAAVGGRLGIIELAIPGLVLMIGLSDAVHMLHHFEEALAEGHARREAILRMASRVGVACLITSVTTAIGFLSLMVADHSAVREFGVKASVAVMVTFFATLIVMPVALSFGRAGRAALPRLPGMGRLTYGKGWLVGTLFVLVMGFAGVGMTRLVVDAKWLEELPDHDPIKKNLEFLETQFSGLLTLEADVQGELNTFAAFRALEEFQARVLESPDVIGCESVTHWLRAANGNPEEMSDRQVVRGATLLRAAGDIFPAHVVRPDFGRGRVIFNVVNLASRRYLALRDRIEELSPRYAPDLRIQTTGYGVMAHESGGLVATTLIESLALSLVAITVLIMFLYRSVRIGLVSMVPNVAPILFALGLTGWLGIPLRVGIVMIYSLGLGLAVDDAIHLITRLVQERRQHPSASMRAALLTSLRTSGAALVVTSVILTIGALCFLPANFQSVHDVGILLTAVVLVALIADLFVLPLLFEKFCR